VKRSAERVAPVAQTTHPRNQGLRGCYTRLWCHPFCDAGICVACAGTELACDNSHSATREFVWLAWMLGSHF